MVKCPRCGSEMIWGGDFSFEDFGLDEEGIVSNCSCGVCDVSMEIFFPEIEVDRDNLN